MNKHKHEMGLSEAVFLAWNKKDHKINLHEIASSYDNLFDKAIIETIAKFDQEICSSKEKMNSLNNELSYKNDENGVPCPEDLEIYDKMGDIYNNSYLLEEQLLSVQEMRIIYSFKSIEIILKQMIKLSFPELNTRDFDKWDKIKSFLNSKSIKFSSISEYENINQIRIVNNNIKHGLEISSDTKSQKINEFSDLDYFDKNSLEKFHLRMINYPNAFLKDLAAKLEAFLYEFDDNRIEEIAKEYKNRMNNKALQKFVTALNKKDFL